MSDDDFMRLALAQARQAAAAGEVPVGAVLVRDGKVIATGRNAPIDAHDPTAHAEIRALRSAAQAVGNYRLDDCELFVTLEPCLMCSGTMLQARIKRVVFGACEPKTGAAGSVINVFAQSQLNHQTELRGGVLAAQSRMLLQDFFRQRRADQREASRQRHPLREDALRTPDVDFAGLPGYQWQPHYVSDLPALGGLRMHYLDEQNCREEGGASTLTYLCLHGKTAWSYEFRKIIFPLVQAGHRVIAPDLIGFGKSDKPKKETFHTFSRHRQILLELVERLDLKNIVLVVSAHSGLLGLTLPMQAPERYRKIWIMNPMQEKNDFPLSAGYLVWQAMSAETLDVDEFLKSTHGLPQMSVEEGAARQLPFPDEGHRAALRSFSVMTLNANLPEDRAISQAAHQFWRGLACAERSS